MVWRAIGPAKPCRLFRVSEMELLEAEIFHERVRPKANKFSYRALYCMRSLEEMARPRRQGLFGIGRAGLFSVHSRDYGQAGVPVASYLKQILGEQDFFEADGEIRLMTMPRILGYGFNPVSFWLCFDRQKNLRAVLSEVNNTFGERHTYFCFHDDHRVIAPGDVLTARKIFHVSPFIRVAGDYAFRFSVADGRIAITINLGDDEGLLLRTSVAGRTNRLTSARLLAALARNPLYPFKVIGLIHYQAVKLFLKGIRHFSKPPPPTESVSHG